MNKKEIKKIKLEDENYFESLGFDIDGTEFKTEPSGKRLTKYHERLLIELGIKVNADED